MKLLLHICCAPCLIYPWERLKEKGFEVAGLFYNPNIHPFSEYKKRKQAVEQLNKRLNIDIIYLQYLPEEFFRAVNLKEKNPQRCLVCWELRLEVAARIAKDKRFEYFSTTLLVSPYQDHELLRKIGDDIAANEGVKFYYEDFRPGFRDAHKKAQAGDIYCQKYCGCIYSEIERRQKKKNK